jgi:uncharacterized iron-regulated membrane protein
MRRGLIYRALFQLHLWAGLTLGIYALLIGLTGSVLVFREEIVEHIAPVPRLDDTSGHTSLQAMLERIETQTRGWNVWSIESPREAHAPWSSYLLQRGKGRSVFVDGQGNIIGERRLEGTWIALFEQFHSNLLIRNGGRWYNGVAGLALAALALTGLYLWWPSRGQWATAFRIVRTSNWKGVIYDLHRVGGALLLVFTLMFCITGAYFTWPAVYRNLVAAVLPVTAKAAAPQISVQGQRMPLDSLVAAARGVIPGGDLVRLVSPRASRQPVTVVFRHGTAEENYKTSQVLLHPATGKILRADPYADRTFGDHVVSFIGPLHTGHFGGLGLKVLWAATGMVLPLLFLTGVVIWCNRVIAPRLRTRTQPTIPEPATR